MNLKPNLKKETDNYSWEQRFDINFPLSEFDFSADSEKIKNFIKKYFFHTDFIKYQIKEIAENRQIKTCKKGQYKNILCDECRHYNTAVEEMRDDLLSTFY